MDRQRRHTRSLATGDFPWESSPALLELPKHGKAAPDQRQKLVLVDDAEIAYSYSFEGRQPHAWHRPMTQVGSMMTSRPVPRRGRPA
jgi:hypothetical protein